MAWRVGGIVRAFLISWALATIPAAALAATSGNVVTDAQDAFGERIGLEQIGLYSESEVRGFSLATAGNYRIDGAYYVPALTPANPLVGGVVTRVGWNALSTDFPAPSGIVEYQLRSAEPGARVSVETGALAQWGPYLDLEGSAATKDGKWGVSGGVTLQPHSYWTDWVTIERAYSVGIAPEWRPNATTSIKLFAGAFYDIYPGDFGFIPTTAKLPPSFGDYPGRFQASWARWRNEDLNAGMIARTRQAGWDLQASYIYSWLELQPSDFTILSVDDHGLGEATAIDSHVSVSYAMAGEVKAAHAVGSASRVFAMLRARESRDHLPIADLFDLGPFDIHRATPVTALPATGAVQKFEDLARQVTAGVGYETRVGDRLQLQLGVQRTRYDKAVTQASGLRSELIDSPWLWNGAAMFSLTRDVTLFATATRGLEESGSAPNNAANRYAVLPAVIAQQYELGLRAKLPGGLSLIGSAFQITKPTAGFAPGNVYALIGEERHRGLELSLAGKIAPGLTAVLGAVAFKPDLTLTSGAPSRRPVGVSSVLALASLDYQVPAFKGLSVDGAVNYSSNQLVNPLNGLEVPARTTLNLGGRYQFTASRQPVTLRVYMSNLTDNRDWIGSQSGQIYPAFPRQLRATLTTTFQ